MKINVTRFIAFVICATSSIAADAKKGAAWKITGQLEESCSCDAACPCWFDSMPTKMMCDGYQALFIKKGSYGKVALDGLAIANAVQSPEGQTMMKSYGKWNFSYLYVDEKASPEQRKALEEIGKTILPYAGSTKTEIRVVPIKRKIEGKEHEITIGDLGTFQGHLIEGGLGGTPKITNPPGADPLHHEYQQGRTTKFTYTDADQNWNAKDSNYMLGTFTLDSAQYAKFSAGLAQKMAGMKK